MFIIALISIIKAMKFKLHVILHNYKDEENIDIIITFVVLYHRLS